MVSGSILPECSRLRYRQWLWCTFKVDGLEVLEVVIGENSFPVCFNFGDLFA